MKAFLGIDVGSVSTKMALLDEAHNLVASHYISTQGQPIKQICRLIKVLEEVLPEA
jgi:activator of 2-hydroxyglutaryl-CoA dehydratase